MFWLPIVFVALLIPILAIVLDSPVAKALARRLERPGAPEGDKPSHERLAFLEGEVGRLATEVERLDEENRFFQKLLAERASAPGESREDRTSPRA